MSAVHEGRVRIERADHNDIGVDALAGRVVFSQMTVLKARFASS
jgi:hypothetical protein